MSGYGFSLFGKKPKTTSMEDIDRIMSKIDHFERVYYKVIDYDTKAVILEKAYTSEIIRKLGVNHNFYKSFNCSNKKYYSHKKTNKKYQFIKLKDEKLV
jgi:hypothetical protein